MSGAWGERQRDRVLAVGAGVFAASLMAGARAIEDSMLSDAVGAGGVPFGVGVVIAVAAVALFAKSFIVRKAVADEPADRPAKKSAEADERELGLQTIVLRTLGLVAILVAYGLLLPWLGYPLTISLLVLASGWLAGAPITAPLLLCALFAGPLLWAMFDWALQVRMPIGSLWG